MIPFCHHAPKLGSVERTPLRYLRYQNYFGSSRVVTVPPSCGNPVGPVQLPIISLLGGLHSCKLQDDPTVWDNSTLSLMLDAFVEGRGEVSLSHICARR